MADRTDRQIVAAAFRGKLAKPVREMTDAYVRRLAREVRAAKDEGRRPTRQAGRGHRPRQVVDRSTGEVRYVTTEHPKAYVRRDGLRVYGDFEEVSPAPIRRSATDRRVAGHGVIVNRDFVTLYPAWRWTRRQTGGVQVIAFGVLQDEWVKRRGSGVPVKHRPLTTMMMEDMEDEEDEEDKLAWRPIYTGNAAGDPDANGATFATYADAVAARDTVFVPGSVEAYIVRTQ